MLVPGWIIGWIVTYNSQGVNNLTIDSFSSKVILKNHFA